MRRDFELGSLESGTALLTGEVPAHDDDRRLVRVVGIVLAYAATFFGALPLALWEIGNRLDGWLALGRITSQARWSCALTFGLGGGALMAHAMITLWRRGRGLPISHLPPRRMVSSGPFARMRHPIYVGYTLAFAGAGLAAGSMGRGLLAPALLTVAWIAYVAGLEEPALRRRFGTTYDRYAATTLRLPLPSRGRLSLLARSAWYAVRPAVERVANRTVLFTVGPTLFVTFGAFVAVGAVMSSASAMALLASSIGPRALDEYIVGLVLVMALGGRVGWLAYQRSALWRAPLRTMRSVGFVSFGAYAAMFAFTAVWWAMRAPAVDLWWLLDRTMVSGYLASAVGRLGCLTYGCCYGRLSPVGLRWRDPRAKVIREQGAAGAEPRVPTQLLAAAWAFAVCALGFALMGYGAPAGVPTAVVALVYGLGRFGMESLREENCVVILGARLTRGQVLSVAIFAGALALLLLAPFGFAAAPGGSLVFRWSEPLDHGTTLLGIAMLVFVVCGYHRHAVGTW